VLSNDDGAVGTCFQVLPSIIVTAFHVLADLGCGHVGGMVPTDALDGTADIASAEVVAVDTDKDLAVLRRSAPLAAAVVGLAPSSTVRLRTEAYVTGVSQVDDVGHEYRYLTATGKWEGLIQRDGIDLGRFTSTAVLPGMSGAPVLRISDGAVLGVVSGRYNSSENWLRDSVWVTCAENVAGLMSGVSDAALHRALIFESRRASALLVAPVTDADVTGLAAVASSQRGEAPAPGEHSVGPQEAALEAATILLSLNDSCRDSGALMEVVNWLTVQAALAGQLGVAGARGFRNWVRVRGLDPRVLLTGLPQHEEAMRRWTSPLHGYPQKPSDLAAMLALFVRVLIQQLDEDLFENISGGCRCLLKAALSGDRSATLARFLDAVSAQMPPLSATSTELVAFAGTGPATSAQGHDEQESGPQGSDGDRQHMLSTAAQSMCRLPEADPLMVGRDDLVSRISAAIGRAMAGRRNAIAFLSGQPGVGTSEVAKAVARNLSDDFPGGALYVDLHGLTPGSRRNSRTVVRILAEALRFDFGTAAMEDAEAFDRFFAQLSDRGVLVVLDNAADTSQVAPLIRRVRSCALIVTSRDRLQDYADPKLQFGVKALDRTDSVRLLAIYLESRAHDREDLNAIAGLCDDVPLALRMIGARIVSDPDLNLGHLRRSLASEVTRLEYMEVGPRAVRAAIGLSYAMLEPNASRTLRLMSAFPGATVTATSLGHCTESDPFLQDLTLFRLADYNLAWHTSTSAVAATPQIHFTLYELIRIFAMERLAKEENPASVENFRLRAIRYMLERLIEINDTRSEADISGELDPSAFHAAERLAEEMDQLDVARDLAVNLWTLYSARREVDGVVAVNTVRIGLFLRRGEPDKAANASLDNADSLRGMKAWRHAEDSCQEALRISEAYHLHLLKATAMFKLSVVFGDQKRWEEALEASEQALGLLTGIGRSTAAAAACVNNARFAARLTDHRKALDWARRAETQAERIGDQEIRAHAAFEMAEANENLADFGAALEANLLAERLSEAAGHSWNASVAARRAAFAAEQLNDAGTALTSLNRAIGYLAQADSEYSVGGLVETLVDLSALQVVEQQFDAAESTLEQAKREAADAEASVPSLLLREVMVRAVALRSFLRKEQSAEELAAIADRRDDEVPEPSADPALENVLELLAAWRSSSLRDSQVWPKIFKLLEATVRNKAMGPPWWMLEDINGEPVSPLAIDQ
jgi:tetratricopeptide (TPR) repeat protein